MARVNGGNVGSESVLVVPDTTGFRAALTAELKKLPPVAIDVFVKLDKSQINAEIKRVSALKTLAKLSLGVELSKTAVNEAVAKRKREVVMTLQGKLGLWLKLIAPEITDQIIRKNTDLK